MGASFCLVKTCVGKDRLRSSVVLGVVDIQDKKLLSAGSGFHGSLAFMS